jgi:DNA-binding protein H-NS
MSYTLKQAAEATGKSKSTIFRAIKNNTISGTRDHNGDWQIDPAELHRVFDAITSDAPQETHLTRGETTNEMMMLQREVEVKEEQLSKERAERERESSVLRETIADLRERLDREGTERRQLHAQFTALLTDQRARAEREPPPASTPAPPTSGRGWWVIGGLAVAVIAAVTWWVLNHPRLPS